MFVIKRVMTIAVAPNVNLRLPSEIKEKSGTMVTVSEQLRKTDLHEVPEELKVPREYRPTDSIVEYIDIPTIDLSHIETDRAELVRKLGEAARDWGICRILSHGIPAHLMKELEIHGLNLFRQSDAEKEKLRKHGANYYTGNNTEEKRHSLHWAESFVMALCPWTALDLDVVTQATLDWPTDDEFRKSLLKYLIGLKSTSEKILQLAAESLGLKADFYSRLLLGSGTISARWNYYPACPLPADVLGAHSHTDPNFITWIHQDKVGGLQVEKDGRWYSVKPMEGTLILNIADTFQIWSNGIFRSVVHRVLVNEDVSRISIAWVLHPHKDQSLSAPDELLDEKHPRLYRDLTAREYHEIIMRARESSMGPQAFNGQNHIEALKI